MRKLRSILVQEVVCRTCEHRWFPRINRDTGIVTNPKNCSNVKCKSPYWNKPYYRKKM